jgi:hypothetical protein
MKDIDIKNNEEIKCVERFLSLYVSNESFSVTKNPIENEVDVFVKFKDKEDLKIQITVADYARTGVFKAQISKRNGIVSNIRDRHDMSPVLRALAIKTEKYKKQNKDMSDIFLLIDDQMGDFPKSAMENVDWNPYDKFFKEVWYVGRTKCIYKIL